MAVVIGWSRILNNVAAESAVGAIDGVRALDGEYRSSCPSLFCGVTPHPF